jgi:hypothetical protein
MAKYSLLINKVSQARSVRINSTGEVVAEAADPVRYADLRKRAITNRNAASRADAYRSCGLVKTPFGWE